MMLLTGGAGFIGSTFLRKLNEAGCNSVVVVDQIRQTKKWKNLVDCDFVEYLDSAELVHDLPNRSFQEVIHFGADSNSLESDFDHLYRNNTRYTRLLWEFCAERKIPFYYASSAATYGNGEQGFSDDHKQLRLHRPLTAYGYSKHLFDLWAVRQTQTPPKWIGFKFFNVYGSREAHKGKMASMPYQMIQKILRNGCVRLFSTPNWEEKKIGQYCRDFISVHDALKMVDWIRKNTIKSGVYNIGSGNAHTYEQLAQVIFQTLKEAPQIKIEDIPLEILPQFQQFTEADLSKLKAQGMSLKFPPYTSALKRIIGEIKN